MKISHQTQEYTSGLHRSMALGLALLILTVMTLPAPTLAQQRGVATQSLQKRAMKIEFNSDPKQKNYKQVQRLVKKHLMDSGSFERLDDDLFNLQIAWIDLNGDKKSELFVIPGNFMCGVNSCTTYAFAHTNGQWVEILKEAAPIAWYIGVTSTNGIRDVVVTTERGSALYKFNGERYVRAS